MDLCPPFRRDDCKNWSLWKMIPGAFMLLLPRVLWIFGWLGLLGVVFWLIDAGREGPISSGWRKPVHRFFTTFCTRMMLYGIGGYVVYEELDADYSKYLGPKWRENKFKEKRVSSVICNHIGMYDIIAFMTFGHPPGILGGE